MKGKLLIIILLATTGCDTSLENRLKEGQKITINGEVHTKIDGELVKVSLY